MRTFDPINQSLSFSTSHGLHNLRKKGIKHFSRGGRGTPMMMPCPCFSGSKKLSIGAFI